MHLSPPFRVSRAVLTPRFDGIKGAYLKLVERVRKSKLNLQPGDRPKIIKTRLRNAIVMPSMVGGIVGVYNGKDYVPVEVKFDMIGTYVGEYAITYKHIKHGKTGKGATKSSKHVD
jgi:small subunit ribosomal protein S15e